MIDVQGVGKHFGCRHVLESVSFSVPDRSIAVVLGSLGSGKSVLLRIMAGILVPDTGRVMFDGILMRQGEWADNQELLQRLGYVFQGGALFDSLSVWDNVALPLAENRYRGLKNLVERVHAGLAQVGMLDARHLFPRELSGGMTRLVAIARALVADPQYVFLDEPTTGLDPATRGRIVELVRSLRDDEDRTCVVVTHDLETAHVLANRLYMLKDGRLTAADRVRKEDYEPPCA